MIALTQPSIDTLMLARAHEWDAQEQRDRDHAAQNWRSLRADIFALPPDQRRLIHARAQHYGGPLNPIAYAYFYALVTGFHRPGAPCGMGGKPYSGTADRRHGRAAEIRKSKSYRRGRKGPFCKALSP